MIDWLPPLLSEIVNTASSPSSTVTSLMVTSPRTSSSSMVPVAVALAKLAPNWLLSLTVKASACSGVVSSVVCTEIVLSVWPAVNSSVVLCMDV